MKTEFTAEVQGSLEDVLDLFAALVQAGAVQVHQMRIQGQPIDVATLAARPLAAELEAEAEIEPASPEQPNALAGVDFASAEAAELAIEEGLTAEDFEGRTPDSDEGFTLPDVEAVLAADLPPQP